MVKKLEISQKIDAIKENEKFWAIATFFLTMIIKIVSNLEPVNIALIRDEIGYLALPTTLAGLDWHNVIQLSSYYGFGYIIFFTPLFKWIDNAYVIWAVIRLVNIIGLSVLSVGLFHLQKNVFKRKDIFWNSMVAVFVCQFASISWNQEYSIFVATWIAACILWAVYNASGKKKVYLSVFLAFWLCYSITLHERNIVLTFTVVIMIMFYVLLFRDCVVSLGAFIPSFVVFYYIQQNIKNAVLDLLYTKVQNGGTIANTEVFSENMFWFFEDLFGAINAMGSIIVPNIYTLINRTYGFAILAFVLLMLELFSLVKKENRQKEKIEKNPELFFLLFSFLATGIIMAGLAVKWGRGIYVNTLYNYKAMTYFRYYGTYIYPAIFCFLASKRNKDRKIYIWSILIYLGAYVCMKLNFIDRIMYAIQNAESPVSIYGAWVDWFESIADPYMAALVSLLCILLIFLLFWKFGHKEVLTMWIAGLMATALVSAEIPQFTCYVIDGTYKAYTKLEDELPDVLYVDPAAYAESYTLQFMLMDTSVVLYKPDSSIEEFVYFSSKKDPMITDARLLHLNVYEYLYVRGEELQELFTQAGYEFEATYEEECIAILDKLQVNENTEIIIEDGSDLYERVKDAGYDAQIEDIYIKREAPAIMFFKTLWMPVGDFHTMGYYVYELGGGYVATNDEALFVEIEKLYMK